MATGDITLLTPTSSNRRYRPSVGDPGQLLLARHGYQPADGTFTDGVRFHTNVTGQVILSNDYYFQGTSNTAFTMVLRELPLRTGTTRDAITQTRLRGNRSATVQYRPASGLQELIIGMAHASTATPSTVFWTNGTLSYSIGESYLTSPVILSNAWYLELRLPARLSSAALWVTTIRL